MRWFFLVYTFRLVHGSSQSGFHQRSKDLRWIRLSLTDDFQSGAFLWKLQILEIITDLTFMGGIFGDFGNFGVSFLCFLQIKDWIRFMEGEILPFSLRFEDYLVNHSDYFGLSLILFWSYEYFRISDYSYSIDLGINSIHHFGEGNLLVSFFWVSRLVSGINIRLLMKQYLCVIESSQDLPGLWSTLEYKSKKHNTSLNHISKRFFYLVYLVVSFSLVFSILWVLSVMSQSGLVRKGLTEGKAVMPKRKIKIPHFDNSALIAGYSKTIIGRCMNPRAQDMKTLLFMFPRIWQLEGKVVGADLGLGKFQFDFDNEEDIDKVLQMEPFHFDYWMVSMVRWRPTVDPSYPSTLTFWIRILGVPLQFWADPTFRSIGKDLGHVDAVDIDGGRVQVTLDGLKPLCFETEIEFDNGEETTVSLRYERLHGFCKVCFSLCHEDSFCPQSTSAPIHGFPTHIDEVRGEKHNQSYRGAVLQDRKKGNGPDRKHKGGLIEKVNGAAHKEEGNRSHNGLHGTVKTRADQQRGETSTRNRRFQSSAQLYSQRILQEQYEGLARQRHLENLEAEAKENEAKKNAIALQQQQSASIECSPRENASTVTKLVRKSLFQDQRVLEEGLITEETTEPELISEMATKLVEEVKDMDLFQNQVLEMEENEVISGSLLSTTSDLVIMEPTGLMSQESLDNDDQLDVVTSSPLFDDSSSIHIGDSMTGPVEQLCSQPIMEERDSMEIDASSDEAAKALVLSEALNKGTDQALQVTVAIVEEKKERDFKDLNASATGPVIGKGKKPKGNIVLKGVSSKKRNVQMHTTPRKRPAPKTHAQISEGINPENQGTEKGIQGGAKPPKPTGDK